MVPCPVCSLPLVLPGRGGVETAFCTGCRREVTAVAWPALHRAPERPAAPQTVAAGEAACFACPDRAATGVCDGCGCYTCPACEARWFGESLCLTCLHARRELTAAPRFRNRAPLYDNIALMMLVLPILVIPFYGVFLSALAAPVALFLVVRHRKAPRGIPPRGPLRLILAGTLAVLLMLLVVAGIGTVVYSVVALDRKLDRLKQEAVPVTDPAALTDPSGDPATEEVPAGDEAAASEEEEP